MTIYRPHHTGHHLAILCTRGAAGQINQNYKQIPIRMCIHICKYNVYLVLFDQSAQRAAQRFWASERQPANSSVLCTCSAFGFVRARAKCVPKYLRGVRWFGVESMRAVCCCSVCMFSCCCFTYLLFVCMFRTTSENAEYYKFLCIDIQ